MSGVITSANSDVLSDGWEEVLSIEDKILSSPPQFKDWLTGEEIPNDRCLLICQELDKTHKKLKECREIYKRVMRDTHGSEAQKKAAASLASDNHVGGGRSQLWDRLSDEKICISMCVTAPPADTQQVAEQNQSRLLMVIFQCDPTLQGMCQDIWTSIKEIGTLKQTHIYARYPYHLGEKLHKLCKVLDTVSVENHTFSAKVVTEGRTKLHHNVADVKPWELHINGHKLQPLGKEEIIAATMMHPASW